MDGMLGGTWLSVKWMRRCWNVEVERVGAGRQVKGSSQVKSLQFRNPR